jgi:alkylation response protein AidB-like acyl-CoA dehydrogenase
VSTTPTVEEYAAAIDAWLAARFPLRDPERDDDRDDTIARAPCGHAELVAGARAFQKDLMTAGFAGVTVPLEYRGRGLGREHAAVVSNALARYDTPPLRPLGIGLGLALPTLLAVGTEEQKRRYIPSLLSGEHVWCQLFSEPDAGSDLVSLRTRADLDGGEWIVNGQKVWSSYASDARFGMLLVRTDPGAERPHAGITMLILPMDAPGVDVRPLVDIAGGRHFNEVYLEDVRVPVDHVLGEVNRGWQVANGTLGGERSNYRGGSGGGRRRRQVLDAARRAGALGDPTARQRTAAVIIDECILEWLGARMHAGAVAGGHPAAGPLMKVAAGNLEQKVAELVADLGGPSAVAWDRGDADGDVAAHALNASRQATIAGGTHQIQRNILGERVLGLPR